MNRLKARSEVFGSESPELPVNIDRVLGQYDGYISKLLADINHYRRVCLFSFSFIVLAFIVLIYALNLPDIEYVVITVDDQGHAEYVGMDNKKEVDTNGMLENVIHKEITDVITGIRTISFDGQMMYEDIISALGYFDREQSIKMNEIIDDEDPFSQIGRYIRRVSIESIIRTSSTSFQADWIEINYTLTGVETKRQEMRGLFTFRRTTMDQYKNLSEKERQLNPLGYYIVDFNFTEVGN